MAGPAVLLPATTTQAPVTHAILPNNGAASLETTPTSSTTNYTAHSTGPRSSRRRIHPGVSPTRFYPGDSARNIELRRLLQDIINSDWFQRDEREPNVHVLRPFVEEVSTSEYRCTVDGCNHILERLDRMEDHFRLKHINHRPYPCGGKCSNPNCGERFSTKETRKAHLNKGTNRVICENCNKEVDSKNLRRHKESQRCKFYTRRR